MLEEHVSRIKGRESCHIGKMVLKMSRKNHTEYSIPVTPRGIANKPRQTVHKLQT